MKTIVPVHFREKIRFPYPPHQRGDLIEEYADCFFSNAPNIENWTYLPVHWTGWFCNHDYGKNQRAMRELYDYVESLPSSKYFTVVQNDDGTLCDDLLHKKGCIIFGAGGIGDIPIPLLCDPHPCKVKVNNLQYKASFVGNPNTHPCRGEMMQAIVGKQGYFCEYGDTGLFEQITIHSKFCLAPRGYGKTSYRMYEAISMGAIPIYIYDELWLPFCDKIDWKNAVLIPIKDIEKIDDILSIYSDNDINSMRNYWDTVKDKYFTMQGCCEEICKILNCCKNPI
jgi:hypothetical protein